MAIVNICSFHWHDPRAKHTGTYSFGPKHVNSLFRQLKKGADALKVSTAAEGEDRTRSGHEFRFYLFTDSPDLSGYDFTTGLTVIPLWQDFRDIGRCFTRLRLFDPAVRDRYLDAKNTDFTVMIDLDVVIIKPEEFLKTLATKARMQPFLGYRDTKNPRCYSGTLWRIDEGHFGRFKSVYDSFRHTYDTTVAAGCTEEFFSMWNRESSYVGSDQCHITTHLGEHTYPTKINDRDDGVYDAWQINDLPGGELPTNATVVFWNGRTRDPSIPEVQDKYPYVKEFWNDA